MAANPPTAENPSESNVVLDAKTFLDCLPRRTSSAVGAPPASPSVRPQNSAHLASEPLLELRSNEATEPNPVRDEPSHHRSTSSASVDRFLHSDPYNRTENQCS